MKILVKVRELKKCVEYFYLMDFYGYGYDLDILNRVVDIFCGEKFVDEVRYVVVKLKDWIKLNGVIYKYLICGFCDVGDVIEVLRMWNLMMGEGFEVDIDVVNIMMERFFKDNWFEEGLKFF